MSLPRSSVEQGSQAADAGGWLSSSSPATLSPPTLISPANNATGVSTTPTLTWNSVTEATSYQVQVWKWPPNPFYGKVRDEWVTITSFSIVIPLAAETEYFWRVKAKSDGETSNWSAVWSFTTVSGTPPPPPTLVSPADGATGVSITPTLSWSDVAGATGYQVQVKRRVGISWRIVYNNVVSTTSVSLTLFYQSRYLWKVSAVNNAGAGDWSGTWEFTTRTAPSPALVSPANGATDIWISPTLTWSPVTGVGSYAVQVATNSNFNFANIVFEQGDITTTSLTVSPALLYNTQYFWRVNAEYRIGQDYYNTEWSSVWSFTTMPLPSAPALVSPANGATDVWLTPTLTWTAASGAMHYTVHVSADSGFTTLVFDNTTRVTSQQLLGPAIGLSWGTQYFWRVKSWNQASVPSAWSDVWSFTIMSSPSPPSLVSPGNGATGVSATPVLTWNPVVGAGDALYRMQIATDSSFTSTVCDLSRINGASASCSLAPAAQYFWRVNATYFWDWWTTGWSDVWSFSTVTTPAPPILVSPANGATGVPVGTNLTWTPSGGATSSQIQVATDSNFTNMVLDYTTVIPSTSLWVNLSHDTQYFWRVRSSNEAGTSDWSSVWSFRTAPLPPPAPTLDLPGNGARGISLEPGLFWDPATRATSYRVRVSRNLDFSDIVFDRSGVTTTWVWVWPALTQGTQYFWQVNASNANGTSDWSSIWSFTTAVIPPPPTLLSPANGATGVPRNVQLRWSNIPEAFSYQVQVSLDANFSNRVLDQSGLLRTYTNVFIAYNTQFFWRVNSGSAAGTSAWSDVWNFTTELAVPELPPPPRLLSPANGSGGVPTIAILSWFPQLTKEPVTHYQVQVSTDSKFIQIVVNQLIRGDTSVSVSLQPAVQYFWRVNASNQYGTSAWSDVWGFITAATTGAVNVNATLDGMPWSGRVDYTLLTGFEGRPNSVVPYSFTNMPPGTYTLRYNSGGPTGATLVNITPSATQTLSAGGTITFTLNFRSLTGTINVNATLDGMPWSGAVGYTLTGPPPVSFIGRSVPQNFSATAGSWILTYTSGGPTGAVLFNITPSSTQTLTLGGIITFTLNFRRIIMPPRPLP